MKENYKRIPLSKIVVENWNYKKNDEFLMEQLINNINRTGQIENLLVRNLGKGKYGLVNGHHRLEALQKLKIKTAYCYDLGKISLKEAKRIGLETNETKFDSDPFQLAKLVKEIDNEFDDFSDTSPFDDDDMDAFDLAISSLSKEDEKPEKELPKKKQKSETMVDAKCDKYRIIKLEITHELADRFHALMNTYRNEETVSDQEPLEIIVSYMEKRRVEFFK